MAAGLPASSKTFSMKVALLMGNTNKPLTIFQKISRKKRLFLTIGKNRHRCIVSQNTPFEQIVNDLNWAGIWVGKGVWGVRFFLGVPPSFFFNFFFYVRTNKSNVPYWIRSNDATQHTRHIQLAYQYGLMNTSCLFCFFCVHM